jgi:hypothetical protein
MRSLQKKKKQQPKKQKQPAYQVHRDYIFCIINEQLIFQTLTDVNQLTRQNQSL